MATEIRAFGGNCKLMQYDARHPATEQLSALTTHSHTLFAGPAQRQLTAFYLSSVFVEEKPADMMEYALIAKPAGEILCSYMSRFLPGLRTVIHRLPRLATDQTASVTSVETAPALAVLLPIVRGVERKT